MHGVKTHVPALWEELQVHVDEGNRKGKCDELAQEHRSANEWRVKIVEFLKENGLSDFKTSLAMKTSEYEIKKLKREIKP